MRGVDMQLTQELFQPSHCNEATARDIFPENLSKHVLYCYVKRKSVKQMKPNCRVAGTRLSY